MTKSLVDYILSAVAKVFEDHGHLCPLTADGIDRDLTRLSLIARTRGLPAFTLDLPALGKHFDKCLAVGCYTKLDGPLTGTINAKTPIPRLFGGLMLAVFDKRGMLRSDACHTTIATLRQVYNLAKKMEIPCGRLTTVRTVAEYYAVDESLPPFTLGWGREDFRADPTLDILCLGEGLPLIDSCPVSGRIDNRLLEVCQQTFDILASTLGEFKPDEWKPKHGPGAVSDLTVGREFKYSFPTWSDRLDTVFPMADFAFANYSHWVDAVASGTCPRDEDHYSRLIAVPKTQKGPRLIAAEPTANQWCQQIMLDYFSERIAKTLLGRTIHLDDQTHNQRLARLASSTQSHWTVDLKAASDRVSCWLIERLFRRNPSLLMALNASRTSVIFQSIDRESPKYYKLRKLSTMGSACTFPVQSIVFAGLSYAALCFKRDLRPNLATLKKLSREVLVFGDDIIIPEDGGCILEDLLNALYFKVNPDKTFRSGKFRESCGSDCFDGSDVTPSYLRKIPQKRKPASIVSAVDTSNNFFSRGYWRTAEHLRLRTPQVGIPVVSMDAGVLGFKSYVGTPVYASKWDKDLQKDYILTTTSRGSADRIKPEHNGRLLQYFVEAPDPTQMIKWESGFSGRARQSLRRARVYLDQLGKTHLVQARAGSTVR